MLFIVPPKQGPALPPSPTVTLNVPLIYPKSQFSKFTLSPVMFTQFRLSCPWENGSDKVPALRILQSNLNTLDMLANTSSRGAPGARKQNLSEISVSSSCCCIKILARASPRWTLARAVAVPVPQTPQARALAADGTISVPAAPLNPRQPQ